MPAQTTRGPWNPAAKLGVLGDVADRTLPFARRSQLNLLCSLSSPCQSWSREERKAGGLLDLNGWSSIDALCQVLARAQCVDAIKARPRYPLVQSLACVFGYMTLWTQVVPCHELSHHYRSCWLCVSVCGSELTFLQSARSRHVCLGLMLGAISTFPRCGLTKLG